LVVIAREKAVNEVIAADASDNESLAGPLLECMSQRIKVSEFRKVIVEITGWMPVEHLNDR